MEHEISLFVMPGCSVCPQMERLFHEMHQQGAIQGLQIVDVTQHPELAEKYNIRSLPFYLINGVSFSGLKSRQEIDHLLQANEREKWAAMIVDGLNDGQLSSVEEYISDHVAAREATLDLLDDSETELVVRIGLTAIIESLASGQLLHPYEQQFIQLAKHKDKRIALDALYYLSLLSTPSSLQALNDIAAKENHSLYEEARELLAEAESNRTLH